MLAADRDSILEIWPSQLFGWRFNPKGEFGALYLSENADTCVKEVNRHVPDVRAFQDRPRILGTIRVALQKCLALTDPKVLSALGVTEESILPDDSPESIQIAREARLAGFEGILYHSAVDRKCSNLAVFKDVLMPKSSVACEQVKLLSYSNIMKFLN